MSGWGGGAWGSSGWGIGVDPLKLLDAQPKRENVVRLEFNLPVRFTKLLDPKDGSNAERYSVDPVAGTVGADELPARDVDPIVIELVEEANAGGKFVDVVVDRPFSPYPARYNVAANALVSIYGTPLDVTMSSKTFDGLRRGLVPFRPDRLVERRDIANPQSLEALVDNSPLVSDPTLLAGYVVDDTGDYATDAGLISYKKRCYRRIFTKRGRFAHLLGYGVSLPDQVKKLARASTRSAIASEAEAQIRLEPETADVSVSFLQGESPEVWTLRVRARMRTGGETSFDFPVLMAA